MLECYKLIPQTFLIEHWKVQDKYLYYRRNKSLSYVKIEMNSILSVWSPFTEEVIKTILYIENHRLMQEYLSGEDDFLLKRGKCIVYTDITYC